MKYIAEAIAAIKGQQQLGLGTLPNIRKSVTEIIIHLIFNKNIGIIEFNNCNNQCTLVF